MSDLDIAIRKNVEYDKVQYWLVITARNIEDTISTNGKEKFTLSKSSDISSSFVHNLRWNIYIITTVMINVLITINFFVKDLNDNWLFALIFIAHVTCLIYWIDFLAALLQKINEKNRGNRAKTRGLIYLIIDGISLLPLSVIYLLLVNKIDSLTYWLLRLVTLLRFYRIQVFLNQITTAGRDYWKIFILGFIMYVGLSILIFANILYFFFDSETKIYEWNENPQNRIIVCIYYAFIAFLNVGFGDIPMVKLWERAASSVAIFIGYIIFAGVITGTITNELTYRDKKREVFRLEYKETKFHLKRLNTEKKVLEKISENMLVSWKYKSSHSTVPLTQLLPTALKKETLFDINFGLLNRSLIFSQQPRAFLRSVVLHMKNISYLPGDTVADSNGMAEGMICVASGVIEILSEENDETPLVSFTNGTILSEAALFISIPNRCIIRAATYVELQVLMKVDFARVALRYPEICRFMKFQILNRLNFKEEPEKTIKTLETDFYKSSRKKATKRFIQDLKKLRKEETEKIGAEFPILGLYVLSENIPRVKILPVNLVQGRPWILRPNTFFLDVWDAIILVVINAVVYVYPYLIGFTRKISNLTFAFLITTEAFYICDLIVQCMTAIEKKDNFTYIVSIKGIIQYRLTKLGFYFDVLSSYYLSIFADIIWPTRYEFAYLLLSLNRLLKIWKMAQFFKKQENNLKRNLLLVITLKYIYYCSVFVWWISVFLYLEACPDYRCDEHSWFAQLQISEVEEGNPKPITNWPELVSTYWAIIILYGIGYGDIFPTTITDCIFVIIGAVIGMYLILQTMAHASATFRHLARRRTTYQEEIAAIVRFMEEHDLPKVYKLKVKYYFRLQWNYDEAFTLMQSVRTEGLTGTQRTIINQIMKKFLAIPIFRNVHDDFLRILSKSCRICVLGPQEIIIEAGSFVREFYLLESGYCEVYSNGETNRAMIGPLNSFGFIETIQGTPMGMHVRTYTHARIMFVDYWGYFKAVTKFPAVKKQIDDIIKKKYQNVKNRPWNNLGYEPLEDKNISKQTIKLQSAIHSSKFVNVYKYNKKLGLSYWAPFAEWGKFRIFQFCFLPFAIMPTSLFLKLWMPLRLITVLTIGMIAPIHYSLAKHTENLHTVMQILLSLTYIDMLLMFYLAYYDSNGLLLYHPVKTVASYVKGNFLLDLITSFPYDLIFTSEIQESFYFNVFKFVIVLQFYKFWQACYFLESDITRKTDYIKILKFIWLTVIVTNSITGLLILIECSTENKISPSSNNSTSLKDQFLLGLKLYCPLSEEKIPEETDLTPFKMYLIVYYWVTYTMTQIGFGDVTDHSFRGVVAIIIIIVLGVFLFSYTFASLTSAMLSLYNVVTHHRKMVIEMAKFMKLEGVSERTRKQMCLHYEYGWLRTAGATPQNMFTYIPPTLKENIVVNMYEDTIRKVPAFSNINTLFIKYIATNLQEIYFLRGETIVNYHDTQDCIYLIYRGKVDVTSHTEEFVTSLGSGGLFGNISNKPFCLSSVVMTATRNTDILKVDSAIFFKTLQIFPQAKPLITYFANQKSGYIEPEGDNFADNDTERDSIPYQLPSLGRLGDLELSSTDVTGNNKYFYLYNSIYKHPKNPFCTFTILPTSVLYKIIDICTLVFAYWSTSLVLYIFMFQDFSAIVLAITYVLDLFFCVKLPLQLHFSFVNKRGDIVVRKELIRSRYFQSKSSVVIDIISNLPLEVFALAAPNDWILPCLSILRLNKLLRFGFIVEFYKSKEKTLMVNRVYLQLSYFILIVSLMVHVLSCIWYFLACPLGFVQPNTWVTIMKIENVDKGIAYVNAVYFISTVFTTTGFGDIPIFTMRELVFTISCMIFSRFAIAWLAGNMASIVAAQGLSLFSYQERITELKTNFIRQNMSDYQLSKMWRYVSLVWLDNAGKPIPEFITTAPYAMKCKIMNEMFGHHLSQAYPFSQTEDAFLRQLAIYLRRNVFFPGNYIVQQGDIDRTMYFIHKGQVSVSTIRPDKMEAVHFQLTENDHFGMTQGLILGKAHAFSYRAETEVEILSLNLSQWEHLFRYFPEVKKKIYERINNLPAPTQEITTYVVDM